MAITSGQLKASNLTASTTATGASGTGVAPDQRRLFNFSDKIAELAPEESPFFVYLSKTAKKGSTIGLLAAKGKEGFYQRFKYIERSGEPLGKGMCKFI